MAAYNQSAIKSFRRCQKQYSFRHDYAPDGKELVPKRPSLPLSKGSWMHALQEAYHRDWAVQSGFDPVLVYGEAETEEGEAYVPVETWENVHQRYSDRLLRGGAFEDEDAVAYRDLPDETRRLFEAYLRFWKDDRDRYTVVGLEDGTPGIEFVVEVPLTKWGLSHPFKGRIDILLQDLEYGGIWIRDAKWVRSVPHTDERMMSPQALMYAWALIGRGFDVRGFIYDYGRTKAPSVPRILKAGTVSVAKKIDTDFHTYVKAIQEAHGDNWKAAAKTIYRDKLLELKARESLWFRRERIPVERSRIKEALGEFLQSCRDIERRHTNFVPRTYNYTCPRNCDYHELCVAEFQGLDIQPLIKLHYSIEGERYGADSDEDLLGS